MFINKIEFHKYKKLEKIELDFISGINAIFGTNGTCKTSILHVVSNSFQKVTSKHDDLLDNNAITIINKINMSTNPKIEKLSKGDVKYNDPAPNHGGPLYTCHYNQKNDNFKISFRKHNTGTTQKSSANKSKKEKNPNRYRLIPTYSSGKKESLPFACIVYLGLNRLSSFGEYLDDEQIKQLTGSFDKLPDSIKNEIISTYNKFTNYNINEIKSELLPGVKKRARFITETQGIDSNTISAGEDNLMIILTAIYSLIYFIESTKKESSIPAILLIDEFDATLHPEYQLLLLNMMRELSLKYPQRFIVYFTSHSITLLEETTKSSRSNRDNVLYLTNEIDSVRPMTDPDIYKAQALLKNDIYSNIFASRFIPVLLEDQEAADFFNLLIEFFTNKNYLDCYNLNLAKLKVIEDVNISSSSMIKLFSSTSKHNVLFPLIGILDGDQTAQSNKSASMISLPGDSSPETMLFNYTSLALSKKDDEPYREFWDNMTNEYGISIQFVTTRIIKEIEQIDSQIEEIRQNKSAKGKRRELNKELYKKHHEFFIKLAKLWIIDPSNQAEVSKFYKSLNCVARKNAKLNQLPPTYFDIHERR